MAQGIHLQSSPWLCPQTTLQKWIMRQSMPTLQAQSTHTYPYFRLIK